MVITRLSHSPWVSVDEDGVVQEVINTDKWNPTWIPARNTRSRYSSRVHWIVKEIIPKLGEALVQKYIWGAIFAWKSHDIELASWQRVEVKTWRVGSSVSIREKQLESYSENDIYALAYYEMRNNMYPPSHYVQRAIDEEFRVSPEFYLKCSVRWRTLFLIQRPSIVHFFNTSDLRLFHNSSGQAYKSLSRTSAQRIYDENPDGFRREKWNLKFWVHKLDVFKVWNNI